MNKIMLLLALISSKTATQAADDIEQRIDRASVSVRSLEDALLHSGPGDRPFVELKASALFGETFALEVLAENIKNIIWSDEELDSEIANIRSSLRENPMPFILALVGPERSNDVYSILEEQGLNIP